MKKVLFTGVSGFVGKRYWEVSKDRYELHPFSVTTQMPSATDLTGIDAIVHLGGLAHQMQPTPAEKYFDANLNKTKELADLAKQNGVPHFIFISTIKAFGEKQDTLLTETSPCIPENDPYGESKLQAEQYLQSIGNENFTVTIIRPPLIYGPGVKGNLDKLLKLCDSGYPLPFGSINNRRTMIYLDNFIALINQVVDLRPGGLLLAGDDRPVSTTELITEIRKGMGKPAGLFSIPYFVRKLITGVSPGMGMRLFGSLEMDTASTNQKLQFKPPYTISDGIRSMVDFYVKQKQSKS